MQAAIVCKTCEQPITYVPSKDYRPGTYAHDDGSNGHDATPKPQCPKCRSFNYAPYETNWGYGDRCADCNYDFYFSLGD